MAKVSFLFVVVFRLDCVCVCSEETITGSNNKRKINKAHAIYDVAHSPMYTVCVCHFIENANKASMSQNLCKDEQKTMNKSRKTFHNFACNVDDVYSKKR